MPSYFVKIIRKISMMAAKASVGIDGHAFRNQFVGRVSNIGIDYLTGQ